MELEIEISHQLVCRSGGHKREGKKRLVLLHPRAVVPRFAREADMIACSYEERMLNSARELCKSSMMLLLIIHIHFGMRKIEYMHNAIAVEADARGTRGNNFKLSNGVHPATK